MGRLRILPVKVLLLTQVIYWRPDYHHILNEFTWQLDDEVPEMPRLRHFLQHWHDEIDAVISEVLVATGGSRDMRSIDHHALLGL